ncbi:MAG: DNA topoisomerase 3 [Syntrophomonadaceae bacterium]|jgi:DNA topoisomerase-3
MSKKLIITEKPSVGRDIARVLGGFKKHEGYLENDEYVISWAFGHLLTLNEPEDYNPAWRKWSIESLPIIPQTFSIKPIAKTTKQLSVLKNLINRADISSVINAGDAGREGQLIQHYIYQYTGCQKKIERLWLSETTDKAIKKAFACLRPDTDYDNLTKAAIARNQADWIIGINATRAFSVAHNGIFSVGRVQTPTLAILTAREEEIKAFTALQYYELVVTFRKDDTEFTGKWFKEKSDRVVDREAIAAVQSKINGKPGVVESVQEKELNEVAPLLLNLNDVQKLANKMWGYTAAKTLSICQKLYEEKKLLTYPRTDSRHLTVAIAETIPERLACLQSTELGKFLEKTRGQTLGKRYVDDAKVSDHTAIIITDTIPRLDALTVEERNIYLLVARRLLAAFYPQAKYKQTRVTSVIAGQPFHSQGKVMVDLGWKAIVTSEGEKDKGKNKDKDKEKEIILPDLTAGDVLEHIHNEIQEKKTKPPKRFSEADLLNAMEHAGKWVDDEALKEAMSGKGLGTPATRAGIIERLIAVGYVERQKKSLVPTEKGKQLIEIVPNKLKNPELTGEWEKKLIDIEAGKYSDQVFMGEITALVNETIGKVKSEAAISSTPIGNCPKCGQPVKENQKAYGCSGFKAGCDFVIWKTIAGKKITRGIAKVLLEKGSTGRLTGFQSKSGKEFSAILKLNENFKVVFDFGK